MTALAKMVVDLFKSTERFFFAPVSPLSIGVFRAVFGFVAFAMYLLRFVNWRFYFTDEGFLPARSAMEILPDFYRPWVTWYPSDPTAVFVLYLIFLAALLLLMLGLFG